MGFKALYITEGENKKYNRDIIEREIDSLPEGEVLIRVKYSSLNYKDALSCAGNKGVTRKYPHTPGIDAAGIVEKSDSPDFKEGDEVIVTGYDLGMNSSGGLGQYIRVPAEWVVPMPANLSMKEAMVYGTAGFTAALSVLELVKHGVTPDKGEVLVTGSTGGVGSVAVAILAKAGYSVVAVTGKAEQADFLRKLGASRIISREEADDTSGKPMLKTMYAGVVDTVGGNILATAIKSAKYQGTVTTCGLTQGIDIPISVFPFILRGVNLIGIDSVELPVEQKKETWDKIAGEWKLDNLSELTSEITLEEVSDVVDAMLKGGAKGRTIVNMG